MFNQSHIVFQRNTGSDQGANGAQFKGEEIHEPQPNQQFNQSIILSTSYNAESIFPQIHHKSEVILH